MTNNLGYTTKRGPGITEYWIDLAESCNRANLKSDILNRFYTYYMPVCSIGAARAAGVPDIHAKAGDGKLYISLRLLQGIDHIESRSLDEEYVSSSVDKAFALSGGVS